MTNELEDLANEASEAHESSTSLDDLFQEAEQNRERKLRRPSNRSTDPAFRDALDAAAKKMRELYSNPENWKRNRGLVLIDKETQTVIGNFSEWKHISTTARKFIREHQPIQIDGQEVVEGFLGRHDEERLRGVTWDREVEARVDMLLDEVQVECPNVRLRVCLQFNSVVRVETLDATQFGNHSSTLLMRFDAGTNLWEAASVDTKNAIRKAAL